MTQEPPSKIHVTVSRTFDVPPDRVFSAWLVPRMLGQWMFGPRVRDENVVRLDLDPRVGGRFSLKVDRKGVLIDHIGQFLEIDYPTGLSFTVAIKDLPDEEPSVVLIVIAPREHGCELTLTHTMDARWSEHAGRTSDAWATMLDALAELPVAANPFQDH